jgi:hypothetical protein
MRVATLLSDDPVSEGVGVAIITELVAVPVDRPDLRLRFPPARSAVDALDVAPPACMVKPLPGLLAEALRTSPTVWGTLPFRFTPVVAPVAVLFRMS